MKKKKSKPKTRTKTKSLLGEIDWVVGLVTGELRAKSFEVAHAKHGGKLLCGRTRLVKWAGYKRRRITSFVKAAAYERHCRRCLNVIFPPKPRRRR